MYTPNSLLEQHALQVLQDSTQEGQLGLSGKLGTAIYLMESSRVTGMRNFCLTAERLLSEVLQELSWETCGIGYQDGIIGIGVGVSYLYQRGFIQGDPDDVLAEIDALVWSIIDFREVQDDHLASDILGVLLYLYLRIKGRDDKTISYLRDREYLIYAIDWLSELDEQGGLCRDSRIYVLLCLLCKAKVYPTKVDSLMERFISSLHTHQFCTLPTPIDLLGVMNLSVLQPWIKQDF